MRTLRVGIIGTGLAAESHAFDIVSSNDLSLSAVCSRRPERARSFGMRFDAGQTFTSVQEMLRSRTCDCFVIAVPPHAVLDISEAVLDYGFPALIEKPIVTSLRSLDKLAALADSSDALGIASFNRRYQQHVRVALNSLNAIGSVRQVTAQWVSSYANRYATDAPTYRSRARHRHGLLTDTGSHVFDLLLWALGDSLVTENCVLMCNERGADIDCAATLSLGSHGRAYVTLRNSINDRCEDRRVTFEADDGTIVLDDHCATVSLNAGQAQRIPASECRRPVDDLIALYQGRRALGASLRDAATISRLLTGAYDLAGAPTARRWLRPRFKPWGRLNGSC